MDAIDIFPWDDHFNTGLAEIDAQHRRLVALLNRLASQVASGADAGVLDGIFDELADYAVYHFNTEEAVWRAYLAGEPDEVGHRATHNAFKQDVARLKTALGQTASHQIAEEALGFLAHWLASHILEADRSLACIVRGLQRGLPLEMARQQAREEMGGATRALIDLILSIYATLSTNTLRLMRELAEHRQAAAELDKARLALGHERIQLRTLINTLPDLIWLKDPDGVYLSCNSRFEQFFGHTESEVIGHTDFDFFAPELAEFFRANDRAAIAHGGPRINEEEITFADGHRELLETTKTPMRDEGGQLIGVLGIGHDISHLKRAEQALQKQLDFSQALNRIADILTMQQDPEQILEGSARVIGETLGADRALIYDISFTTDMGIVQCEWLNPDCPIRPPKSNYPLKLFRQAIDHIHRTRQCLISQASQIHPTMQADGTGEILHTRLGVRSLLWHPFSFRDDGFFVLVINQLQQEREWSSQDQAFLTDISHSVSVALEKVRLLKERERADADLRIAATAFEAQEGIVITDAEERIIRVNRAYTRITGYSQDEVIGRKPSVVASGRHGEDFFAAMHQSLREKDTWEGEIWNRRKDGTIYPELMVITAVRNAQGEISNYVGTFSDITEHKQHQQELEFLAHYDTLTGLPNRALLIDRLRLALAQARRHRQHLALAFIDLDDFKAVNDAHGHEVGDLLLTVLAERMRSTLRESDTLARIGGDEFVAVIGDLDDMQGLVPLMERLLDAVSRPVSARDLVLKVSCSIGIALHATDEVRDADQLLREADHAMYQAKQAGRNRFHIFDAAQARALRTHQDSVERIRQGLERQEFILHYQPKVHMRSGRVLGVEALIRWQHPEQGLLMPAQFLPEIEHDRVGVMLGEWVLDTALAQLSGWLKAGLDLSLSVNIAANHLQRPDFVERLRQIMTAHPDVPPERLELEVLETTALDDIEHASAMITECALMGVGFALDDFGTGYSSLTYLKRLPARTLKIDQSFVRDMLADPDDLAILEGVLGMARAFRRSVIAEGVESEEHGLRLLGLGCERAQGYGIARPMPPHTLPDWISSWSAPASWGDSMVVSGEWKPIS